MSYQIINEHPDLTPEERERIARDINRSVYRIFKEHDARIKRERQMEQDDDIQ